MRRLLIALMLLFSISASAFALLRPRSSQHRVEPLWNNPANSAALTQDHSAHSAGTARKLTPTIRGDWNPERIPDHVAYAHFLRSLSRDSLVDRRAIALDKMRLESADRLAFEGALRSFKTQMESVRALEQRGGRPSELQRAQRQVLDAVRARIDAEVSAAGRAELDEYVRHYVTPRIVIYEGGQ